jgi:hypothetical protein
MLRVYMQTHHREHPFPSPAIMWDSWRTARQRAAAKLSRSDLNKIPLKGLRNLSGILFWQKRPDPWLVMLHMGHKKLSITQHYLQAITTFNLNTEWICISATTKEEQTDTTKLLSPKISVLIRTRLRALLDGLRYYEPEYEVFSFAEQLHVAHICNVLESRLYKRRCLLNRFGFLADIFFFL